MGWPFRVTPFSYGEASHRSKGREFGARGVAWMYNSAVRESKIEIPVDILARFVGPHFVSPAANGLIGGRSGGA